MNTELLLLHGYSNLYAKVGIEALVGGSNWFTQSLRASPLEPSAFGQVERHHQRARINWILNLKNDLADIYPYLIDNLGFEAGLRGAKYLRASSTQDSLLFKIFRRSGYCVYGWERFWELRPSFRSVKSRQKDSWRRAFPIDRHDILKFQHKYLPPVVRSVTPLADENLPKFVLKQNEEIKAYANIQIVGSKGIIHAVIASDFEYCQDALIGLLTSLPDDISSWYIIQSTSHNWLDEILTEIAIPLTDRLELLVKYFTIMEKNPVGLLNHAADGSQPDPVAPFMNARETQDNL